MEIFLLAFTCISMNNVVVLWITLNFVLHVVNEAWSFDIPHINKVCMPSSITLCLTLALNYIEMDIIGDQLTQRLFCWLESESRINVIINIEHLSMCHYCIHSRIPLVFLRQWMLTFTRLVSADQINSLLLNLMRVRVKVLTNSHALQWALLTKSLWLDSPKFVRWGHTTLGTKWQCSMYCLLCQAVPSWSLNDGFKLQSFSCLKMNIY